MCIADAQGRTGFETRPYTQADYLRGAAEAARGVDIQPLLEKGLQGADMGRALEQARLEALSDYKASRG